MNVNWLFNPCRRHAVDLGLLAAGALARPDGDRLAKHLERCPGCRARLAQLRTLARELTQDGRNLPSVEPSPSLRRRWMAEIHRIAPATGERRSEDRSRAGDWGAPALPWLTGRRLAWSGIAAMWALILFFRFSAPDAPRPMAAAIPPPTLRQLLLAFRTETHELSAPTPAAAPPDNQPSAPDATAPRSECPENHSTKNLNTA